MPKIKIKNLNMEINRRIKLIKTATSVVDIGQQQGAVVNQSDYVGICLAPLDVLAISCDGAGNWVWFYMFQPIGNTDSDSAEIYIDDVIWLENTLAPAWLGFGENTPPVILPDGYQLVGAVQYLNNDSLSHKIRIKVKDGLPAKILMKSDFTYATIVQDKEYGVCLSPHDASFTCTPEFASEQVQFSKVRSSFPLATFVNVPFNVYENGIQIGSNLTLNSLNDMGPVGLTCVFGNMEQTLMTVYNNSPTVRSVRLQPVENFVADVDVTQGNGMVDENSLWLCLAPAQV
ncbi:MAG: hypothetical protein LBQ29_15635 [Acinetobacter sp.]|jgi:hypothetical protein|uniref:hypothetical protein n=1 Tax=Acinetobacter sp. TaxID=472 RepID=UPI002819E5A3|nr:hypothetical protein [Acinetobacter sp.]MDR2062820.1 hypothetical protein [Acinetobacter sp.]